MTNCSHEQVFESARARDRHRDANRTSRCDEPCASRSSISLPRLSGRVRQLLRLGRFCGVCYVVCVNISIVVSACRYVDIIGLSRQSNHLFGGRLNLRGGLRPPSAGAPPPPMENAPGAGLPPNGFGAAAGAGAAEPPPLNGLPAAGAAPKTGAEDPPEAPPNGFAPALPPKAGVELALPNGLALAPDAPPNGLAPPPPNGFAAGALVAAGAPKLLAFALPKTPPPLVAVGVLLVSNGLMGSGVFGCSSCLD